MSPQRTRQSIFFLATCAFLLAAGYSIFPTPLHAVPPSCEDECTFDPLIPCSTSCWDPYQAQTTTCGWYNGACYNVPECGNQSCESVPFSAPQFLNETYSNCPVDCSNGGSSEENPTVPWAFESFMAIDDDGTKMSMWFGAPYVGGAYFPSNVPLYPPAGSTWTGPYPSAPIQIGAQLSRCHIQGVQRLRQSPYIAYTLNSTDSNGPDSGSAINDCPGWADGGAHLFIAKIDSKGSVGFNYWGSNRTGGSEFDVPDSDRNHMNVLMDQDNYHPGGFQAIGDYLVAGMDRGGGQGCKIKFFDVGDPANPVELGTPSFTVPNPGHRAETVGIVRLADGTYLLMVGSQQSQHIHFYQSSGTYLPATTFSLVGEWDLSDEGLAPGSLPFFFHNYQSYNMFRESGTNKIFVMGTAKSDVVCGLDLTGGSDQATLFELSDWDQSTVQLKLVGNRIFSCHDKCNFCAGAGIYIQPGKHGRLGIYSTEHWGHDHDTRYHVTNEGYAFYYVHGVVRFNEFSP